MRIKCEYCGGFINDTDSFCEHCGAPNANIHRESEGVPKTVEELKKWYVDHHLPSPEVTRFFIGENHTGPRAFGIYEENGEFIVYKNKDNGERAVRYRGTDEAYAVNELYMKLKERVAEEKSKNVARRSNRAGGSNNKWATAKIIRYGIIAIVVINILLALIGSFIPNTGYYKYNGNNYYYNGSNWYYYDNQYNDWYETDVSSELSDDYENYYSSSDYESNSNYTDIKDSAVSSDWDSNTWSNSNWDSDSDWSSSDSWDSGGGDWGSDW